MVWKKLVLAYKLCVLDLLSSVDGFLAPHCPLFQIQGLASVVTKSTLKKK